jgi:hypothetical protein
MRTQLFVPVISIILLVFQSCRPNYFIAKDFNVRTQSHQMIAILPVEVIMTGKKPKNLTEEKARSLEEQDSKMFQYSLYNQLLNQSGSKRKHIYIDIQPVDRTMAILNEHKINTQESWQKDPQELARLLKVDAVIKTRIEKHRYMSDLASLGIDIGSNVIDIITRSADLGGVSGYIPNKTNDLKAWCALYGSSEGGLLWKDNYRRESNWQNQPEEVVNRINRRFSKTFPYRNKNRK